MDKVVAITGASAGIGRATALRLARDGATIAICARRLDRLERVADDIRRAGGRALALAADVTSMADMDAFVDAAVRQFGRLDVMMCNAGYGLYGEIDRVTSAQMHEIMDVNFFGTFQAARAALRVFRTQGSGHTIVISSIVGRRGIPFMAPYSATKFAQVGLAECLRAEARGSGLHVSVVYPISTETEFFGVMTKHSGFATRAQGPRQSPDVVANAIAAVIRRPAPEVYPHRMSKGLAVLSAIAPGFCDVLVRRWRREPIGAGQA
ncbi:MAG TPA: SDR family NAD(P)-dependent oxidoreductase [Vicinamibacterales bacterium]|nr:SDR family NAD(P)-dependent oxidoreductase [Vicinamibacterales bacterium]